MARLASPPRAAAIMSGRMRSSSESFMTPFHAGCHKKVSNFSFDSPAALPAMSPAGSLVWSKHQRIASRRAVYELARDLEIRQDLADPAYVVAHFFGKKRRVGPRPGQQLVDGEEPMRVVEQELQQLKFPLRQVALPSAVADQLTFWIQLQSLKVPQAFVPEVEPALIATHLPFDDAEVSRSRLLRYGLKLRQITAHPFQEADLESNQVSVNADPVPGVLPVCRPEVFAFQSS